MRNTADAHLDRVVEAIQTYLSLHPGAADSEIGIAQWWLHRWQAESGESVSPDQLHRALLRLEAQGVMEQLQVPGVGYLWRGKQADSK